MWRCQTVHVALSDGSCGAVRRFMWRCQTVHVALSASELACGACVPPLCVLPVPAFFIICACCGHHLLRCPRMPLHLVCHHPLCHWSVPAYCLHTQRTDATCNMLHMRHLVQMVQAGANRASIPQQGTGTPIKVPVQRYQGTSAKVPKVPVQRYQGTSANVSRYQCKGVKVPVQRYQGTSAKVSRYQCKGIKVPVQRYQGTSAKVPKVPKQGTGTPINVPVQAGANRASVPQQGAGTPNNKVPVQDTCWG